MISVEHLTKKYDGAIAVDDISFTIEKGEVVGLLGPNGAGKTTTIKMLTGYLTPTNGHARVGNLDVQKNSLDVRRMLGYLSENSPLYEEMSVVEYLRFACELHDIPKSEINTKIRRVVDLCGLRGREYQDIKELSKGYRQRVGLAQSLIHDPEFLILDEPTTGLDPNQRIEIRKLIRKIGSEKTVILSSHILSEVEATCTRVLIIHKGKIVASGTPKELTSDAHASRSITLKVKGNKNAVIDKMKACGAINRIVEANERDGVVSLILEVGGEDDAKTDDARKEIVAYIVKNDMELIEIYQKERSLEDIFVKLTKDTL